MSSQLSRSKKRGRADRKNNRKRIRTDVHEEEDEEVVIEDSSDSMDVNVLPVRKLDEISAHKNTDWFQWIPAKETLNAFAKDWLLDWLKYHHPDSEKFINYKKKLNTSYELPSNNSRGKKFEFFRVNENAEDAEIFLFLGTTRSFVASCSACCFVARVQMRLILNYNPQA